MKKKIPPSPPSGAFRGGCGRLRWMLKGHTKPALPSQSAIDSAPPLGLSLPCRKTLGAR